MPRQPRFFVPEIPLHLIQRGNNRAAIFLESADYQYFLDCLTEACSINGVSVHAYALMTNHMHILATPSDRGSVPRAMQSVGRRYVQHFNRAYGRTGTLWEGRYRATAIDSERYLLTCMRYIELNPVRAAIVNDPGRYRWTSYRANAMGEFDRLVMPHSLYEALGWSPGDRQQAWRELCRSVPPLSEISAIREATNRNWALGDAPFLHWMTGASGRQAAPARRGPSRPILRSLRGQTRN